MRFVPGAASPVGAVANHRILAVVELIVGEPIANLPTFLVKPAFFLEVFGHVGLTTGRVPEEDFLGHVARFPARRYGFERVRVPVARRHEIIEITRSRVRWLVLWIERRQDRELFFGRAQGALLNVDIARGLPLQVTRRDLLVVGQYRVGAVARF